MTKMSIAGGLVRSLFSGNKSFEHHDTNARDGVSIRKKWNSLRSYFCGNEANSLVAGEDSVSVRSSEATIGISMPPDSVLAVEDSASYRPLDSIHAAEETASATSSQATVTQPPKMDMTDLSEDTQGYISEKHRRPMSKPFLEEDAAVIIQATFRRFMAKRGEKVIIARELEEEQCSGTESSTRVSEGTSIEVQVGSSVIGRRGFSGNQKCRSRVLKIKEEWDDSTVSSSISRMRIQNRLDAMTRRERALAYAFSQQLRICSKKKQTNHDEQEASISWSWLERWMATRVPDSSPIESSTNRRPEIMKMNHKTAIRKRLLDAAAVEEKESSGSNEVPAQFNTSPMNAKEERLSTQTRGAASHRSRYRKICTSREAQRQQGKTRRLQYQHERSCTKRPRNIKPSCGKDTKCEDTFS